VADAAASLFIVSVGVLEDKSSSSRILEDNFEVLGLGLGLEACVLDSNTVYSSLRLSWQLVKNAYP